MIVPSRIVSVIDVSTNWGFRYQYDLKLMFSPQVEGVPGAEEVQNDVVSRTASHPGFV